MIVKRLTPATTTCVGGKSPGKAIVLVLRVIALALRVIERSKSRTAPTYIEGKSPGKANAVGQRSTAQRETRPLRGNNISSTQSPFLKLHSRRVWFSCNLRPRKQRSMTGIYVSRCTMSSSMKTVRHAFISTMIVTLSMACLITNMTNWSQWNCPPTGRHRAGCGACSAQCVAMSCCSCCVSGRSSVGCLRLVS